VAEPSPDRLRLIARSAVALVAETRALLLAYADAWDDDRERNARLALKLLALEGQLVAQRERKEAVHV
jgi:hypothetical protein